jgi:hypothetical protein
VRIAFSGVLFVCLLGMAELGARQIYRDALRPHPPVKRNRLGYRDHEIRQKRPDRYRIIVIGDSFTFGDEIEERDRFSNVMQEKLGPKFEVLNFGTRAHNLPQHLRTLDRALRYQPDFVLLQLYENDFEMPGMTRPSAYTLPEQAERRMLHQFVLYRLISTASARLQETIGLSEEYSHYMARHLQDADSPDARQAFGMLETFITKSQAAHVPVGTVLFPALWVLGRGRSYPFDYLHAHVGAICRQKAIPCVDLYDEFAHDEHPERLWVNPFDSHPNAEANHRAARVMLETFGPVWSH